MNNNSKYDSSQIERATSALKIALNAQNIPQDLALMALGATASDMIKSHFQAKDHLYIAEQFGIALKKSIKD